MTENQDIEPIEDVEGHKRGFGLAEDDGDDVEGHKRAGLVVDDGDDVEGHKRNG